MSHFLFKNTIYLNKYQVLINIVYHLLANNKVKTCTALSQSKRLQSYSGDDLQTVAYTCLKIFYPCARYYRLKDYFWLVYAAEQSLTLYFRLVVVKFSRI